MIFFVISNLIFCNRITLNCNWNWIKIFDNCKFLTISVYNWFSINCLFVLEFQIYFVQPIIFYKIRIWFFIFTIKVFWILYLILNQVLISLIICNRFLINYQTNSKFTIIIPSIKNSSLIFFLFRKINFWLI